MHTSELTVHRLFLIFILLSDILVLPAVARRYYRCESIGTWWRLKAVPIVTIKTLADVLLFAAAFTVSFMKVRLTTGKMVFLSLCDTI